MITKKYKEAIVYACARKSSRKDPGIIPSSWDIADREYGWTGEDYARAVASLERDVDCLDISIDVFSFDTGKGITIANRGKTNDEKTAAVLDRSEDRLFDGGEYGIYDTLSERFLLHPFPMQLGRFSVRNTIIALAYKDGVIYFSKAIASDFAYHFHREEGPFKLLDIRTPGLMVPWLKLDENWETLGITPSRAHPFGKSFEFIANSRQYIVNNRQIIDSQDNEQILVSSGLILNATGFPEDILLEKFPKLKGK